MHFPFSLLNDFLSKSSLSQTAPNMGGYLMDMFVGRERETALAAIVRA